jgi:hypothetical protein
MSCASDMWKAQRDQRAVRQRRGEFGCQCVRVTSLVAAWVFGMHQAEAMRVARASIATRNPVFKHASAAAYGQVIGEEVAR